MNNKINNFLFYVYFIVLVCCFFMYYENKVTIKDVLSQPAEYEANEVNEKPENIISKVNKIEQKKLSTIELSEIRSDLYVILDMINNNLPYDLIVSKINSLELSANKTIKELFDTGAINENDYQMIMSKIYSQNNYRKNFAKRFERDFFEIDSEVIYTKDAYYVEFKNETLTVENITKNKLRQIDLSNFVQGVTTPERIQIYSQLQKLDGSLLEIIISEVGGMTSAKGTAYGGWFMSYGIATLDDYNALAHEAGHAIDNHFSNNKYEHFSDEFITNELYHNEILSMYEAGKTNSYYHSLIGNYEYKKVPASEREVYAECARTILGYSDAAHVKLYKQFLPNTLKYVASNMKDMFYMTDEQRGSAIKKQALIVPKGGHFKAAKARLEQGHFNSLYVNDIKVFQ